MSIEVEIKAWVDDPAALEARLASIGEWQGESIKEDVYFAPRSSSQTGADERFRLRRSNGKAVVTFKQRRMVGNVEVNDETEFAVDDAHAFYKLASHLGCVPYMIKRKHSRLYRVGQVRVELNRVERLGHFVEVEILCGPDEVDAARARVTEMLARLEVPPEKIEPQRYNDLLHQVYPARYEFVADDPQNPFRVYPLEPLPTAPEGQTHLED
ncbi:MAG: class IV adenylate cyclase [Anaerolineae bacterium]